MQATAVKYATPTIEGVKEALLSLGDALNEAEATGVFGSLARGIGFTEHSDIDIYEHEPRSLHANSPHHRRHPPRL